MNSAGFLAALKDLVGRAELQQFLTNKEALSTSSLYSSIHRDAFFCWATDMASSSSVPYRRVDSVPKFSPSKARSLVSPASATSPTRSEATGEGPVFEFSTVENLYGIVYGTSRDYLAFLGK